MSESISTAERYLSATQTSDMRVQADVASDADRILAAAFAVSGRPRDTLALEVYNVLASTDMRGAKRVSDRMSGWLVRRYVKGKAQKIKRVEAFDISMMLLKLWHKRVCVMCAGRGHPLVNNTPVLDESRECPACHGTGQIPIEQLFRHEHVEHARWLESEINSLCGFVFDAMARRLSKRMDL
jgi:hypothetical protein